MVEYCPQNEVVKKQYEDALLHGKHRDLKTVKAVWNSINLFEDFTNHADFKSFNNEQAKSFKRWLERKKNKSGELLSLSTIRSTLNQLREFFEWLAIHPKYVRKVDGRAIQYLRLSDNANRAARASREKTAPTLDELEITLQAMPHHTEIEKRNRALFALTVITCIRDDALITLKMKDIDVANKTVWQDPKHVRTKRRKGILTRFVSQVMPLAEKILLDWVHYALNELSFRPNDPLFPKTLIEPDLETRVFKVQGLTREHWSNAQPARDIFKEAFEAVNLPYFNPHLFRKTICKWALKHCSQYEYKALSQNLGHDHAMTTYNSYGTLTEDEQLEAVANIGSADLNLQHVPTDELMKEAMRRIEK